MTDDDREMTILELVERAHKTAVEKGWWEGGVANRSMGDQFANFHAELAEAWECWRALKPYDDLGAIWPGEDGKPEGFIHELADVYIRIADTVGAYGLATAFADAIDRKLRYNEKRPYRHGGKRA